jgi:N-acetylglucosamine kinase-like BadF-type ATPase
VTLLLGAYGTGAKTQAVVSDLNGQVLGRGLGPSSNPHRVGTSGACAALGTAIEAAISQAPGSAPHAGEPWGHRISAACLGLSGIDQPADELPISDWLRQHGVLSRFKVVNDAELILVGGTPDGWGMALISGDGSVCLGRTPDGRTARAGGWGPRLGDEGSGFQIAMQAMQVATQAADGRGSAHALLEAILHFWLLRRPEDLVEHVHHGEIAPTEIAELAVVVLERAARGDMDAAKIVNHAGQALARHVDAVARQLDFAEPPPLALGGRHVAGLRPSVMSHVKSPVGALSVVADPAQAAIRMAKRLLAGDRTARFVARLHPGV